MKFVALLAAGFVTASAPALAQYAPRPMVPIGPMPPEGVFEMVRQMGLEPLGPPFRNGPVWVQRAADYYGKPLRVVVDAARAQVVSVEPIGGPPMLHGGPYASAGAPYWRRSYPYGGMTPDDDFAPPGSMMAPHGQQPQSGLAPAAQPKPAAKSAAITPGRPPVPRKRPSNAPQEAAGSVEPLQAAPQPAPAPVPQKPPAASPAASEKPANAMPPVAPLE